MKRLVLVAVLSLVACTPDANQHAHTRPSQRPAAPVLHPQDRDFLEKAAQGSNAEVAIGGLGMHRALRAEVCAFGQRMVADHADLGRQLAAIADKHRILLPTDLGDQQASYDRVVDLNHDEFEREFVKVMVDDHNAAVLLFRGEASGGVDPEIRAFAARALPLIESHLAHAKSLGKPVDELLPAHPQTGERPADQASPHLVPPAAPPQ